VVSALHPKADIAGCGLDVRFVPKADIAVVGSLNEKPGVRAKAPRPQAARPIGSILRLQPGYDFRPYMSLCVASDQNPEMLQADTEFTGIFNNLHVFCHCIREWLQ